MILRQPGWQELRVFVSSTFDDMVAERDYLVRRVFPGVSEWCEERHLHLLDIDLRWGITEKDATETRDVVRICLSCIEQCAVFVGFLGQRYGWRPDPVEVKPSTAAAEIASALEQRLSITEMEIRHALYGAPGAAHGLGLVPSRRCLFYLRDQRSLQALSQVALERGRYLEPSPDASQQLALPITHK